jgi:hypothetical protein
VPARTLHGKQSLQNVEDLTQRGVGQTSQARHPPISIDSPERVRNQLPIVILKTAEYAKGLWEITRCKQCEVHMHKWSLSSSRETTTQGLVFLISDL